MPISFALLLCIPIGLLFFFIARLSSGFVIGSYGRRERRASLAFGVFGVSLIPDLWTFGCLQEEFPNTPGTAIAFLLFVVEGLVLAAIFRLFPRRGMDVSEPKERVEP